MIRVVSVDVTSIQVFNLKSIELKGTLLLTVPPMIAIGFFDAIQYIHHILLAHPVEVVRGKKRSSIYSTG